MELVSKIIKAQDFLQQRYGKEGYQRLVGKMKSNVKIAKKQGVPAAMLLAYIARDSSKLPETRLIALACLGEEM